MSVAPLLFFNKRSNSSSVYLIIIALIFFGTSFCRAQDMSDSTVKLTVHFETNGRDLNAVDQKRLKKAFKDKKLTSETKILVVGYTDSTGKTNANYTLSRLRANAVKNMLIALLKVDSSQIIAVGRGSESPVAGNDTAEKRARNRRVEILTLGKPGAAMAVVKPLPPPPPPDPKKYMAMLEEAQRSVKTGSWENALIILKKAREKGAEHHALWHLLYGIVGYHQGISTDQLISYFEKSLQLDRENLDAIDYWGRAKARKYIETGFVSADMGRSATTAIKVETISQEYEFMKLFEVEPLQHVRLSNRPIDAWQCRTSDMKLIDYFFDISSAYQWAYSSSDRQKPEQSEESASNLLP